MANNIEVCAVLVQLYADYKHIRGDNTDYAEVVARAIVALAKED